MTNNMTIAVDLGKDITNELLIEQHGGYEKTKSYRDYLVDFGSEFAGVNPDEIRALNSALSDYRRAHNIFEIGDYVLPNSNYSDEVHFLSEWYIDGLDFRYKTSSGRWGIIVKSCMTDSWRHATDEEITANRRLDQ